MMTTSTLPLYDVYLHQIFPGSMGETVDRLPAVTDDIDAWVRRMCRWIDSQDGLHLLDLWVVRVGSVSV